ncbi:dihydrodipicolinate synthase family protein [Enterobacteriaceae bacterium RIT691]|nr:dihydrodipicolinate synthase family protein [Enterobacteriaceae bacterium RIT691]
MDFSGLCAFPLTPVVHDDIDWASFRQLIDKLRLANVNAIGVLGSTGCYPYFSPDERRQILRVAVEAAGATPVMVSISALRLKDVLSASEAAQKAGASAVMLSPQSYQPLNDDEVFHLYQSVCRQLSVPLCVYDNPRTTQFTFSDDLLQRIAELPNVQAIKIPPVSTVATVARERITTLRALLPAHIRLGISGDACATEALIAGCDLWCSVIGGLLPYQAGRIVAAVQKGEVAQARLLNAELMPLWEMFSQQGGSLRVVAAAAELLGEAQPGCLPQPLQSLQGAPREALREWLLSLASRA